MRLTDGGYNEVQYHRELLLSKVEQLRNRLPEIMELTGADSVVVSGKSGISMAFALQMVLDFNLVVVRKRGEGSHGEPVEGRSGAEMHRYIILDDFVATGSTVRRIRHDLEDYAGFVGQKPPQCVGVLTYSSIVNWVLDSTINVYGMGC